MEVKTEQKTYSPAITAMMAGRKKAIALGKRMGMPRGVKTRKVLEREKVLRSINQVIMDKAEKIIRASIIPALGMNFVYRIDEEKDVKGRVIKREHVLVEDPEEIALALDEMESGGNHPEDKYYYVTTKAPDYRAGESLLNRAFGKAKESVAVEVEHKFSLRDLGKKALENEKSRAKEIAFTESAPVETGSHVENIGSEVPRADI